MTRSLRRFDRTAAALLVFALAACAGEGSDAAPDESGAMTADEGMSAESVADVPTVRIISPLDGDTLDAGPVTVTLEASGVEIAPVAEGRMETAHHHIYLDEDLRPEGEPVPAIANAIVHLGDGSATFTFEEVPPGEHRLIAVMADLTHVPLVPQRLDTVVFVVR